MPATYLQINALREASTTLGVRITVAIAIYAVSLLPSVTPADVIWAKEALANPAAKKDASFWEIIASPTVVNLTIAQVDALTDAQIQSFIQPIVRKY